MYKQVNVKYQVLISAMMENSQMFGKWAKRWVKIFSLDGLLGKTTLGNWHLSCDINNGKPDITVWRVFKKEKIPYEKIIKKLKAQRILGIQRKLV